MESLHYDLTQTETAVFYYLDKDPAIAASTVKGIELLTKIYGKRFAKDSTVEDTDFHVTFRRIVLGDNPNPEALHLLLELNTVPNTWTKQSAKDCFQDALLIKILAKASKETFALICDGLRVLPDAEMWPFFIPGVKEL